MHHLRYHVLDLIRHGAKMISEVLESIMMVSEVLESIISHRIESTKVFPEVIHQGCLSTGGILGPAAPQAQKAIELYCVKSN